MLKGKTCSKGWEKLLKENGYWDIRGGTEWMKARVIHL